jgi:hypothetical protein
MCPFKKDSMPETCPFEKDRNHCDVGIQQWALHEPLNQAIIPPTYTKYIKYKISDQQTSLALSLRGVLR